MLWHARPGIIAPNVAALFGSGGGGGGGSTWNPADSGQSNGSNPPISLSNGNLTASYTGTAATDNAVRSTSSMSSGKKMVRFTTGATFSGGDTGVGIVTLAQTLGAEPGNSASNAFIVFANSGNIWFNGGSTGSTLGSLTTAGTIIDLAIDFGASLGWFRAGAGNWNGSGTANPATGAGGINISAKFPGAAAFAVFCVDSTSSVTVDFNPSTSLPSGFSAWG